MLATAVSESAAVALAMMTVVLLKGALVVFEYVVVKFLLAVA